MCGEVQAGPAQRRHSYGNVELVASSTFGGKPTFAAGATAPAPKQERTFSV